MIENRHRPKKSLGQNFLIDDNIVRKIISALDMESSDYLLEIGPGHGVMTRQIISMVRKLVAIELDRELAHRLRTEFSEYDNFRLIEGDFLKVEINEIFTGEQKWKVFGNIPYHITTPIIFKMIEQRKYVRSLTLMMQKEVAQRIVAEPYTKAYGILSVMCQLYADVRLLFKVSNMVFKPRPKVDSAVVRFSFLPEPRYPIRDETHFVRMLRAMFGQRRKIIRNSLKKIRLDSYEIDFDLMRRPEELTIAEIVNLSNLVCNGYKRPERNR